MTRDVVMFSGGSGSWAAAKRVVERRGRDRLTLLFTDTLFEDQDTYRSLIEGAANVFGVSLPSQLVPALDQWPDWTDRQAYKLFVAGLRAEVAAVLPGLVWLQHGLDVWDVFFRERYLGNSSVDPCSKILKRQLAASWLKANCDPAETVCTVGIDFTERHRFDDGEGGGIRPRRAADGWTYEAPLCEPPWMAPWDVRRLMADEGLRRQRLYAMGYPHANCGGFCVKAGFAGFALLLRTQPERYAFSEDEEQEIRAKLGDVSILTDRSGGGGKRPLTLKEFRERLQSNPQHGFDLDDFRGCGCFLDEREAPPETAVRSDGGVAA